MKEEMQYHATESNLTTDFNYKHKISWPNVIAHAILQSLFLGGIYFMYIANWRTSLWAFFYGHVGNLGLALGAHRYYAHRAFKAHFPLRLLIVLCNTIAGQNSLHTWVRDHRTHHKFSDTDADPHNSNRGFFFAHMGWLLVRKHPAVIAHGKTIDLSDIEADPLIMFQKKYYLPLYLVLALCIPIAVPMYFWNETFICAFMTAYGWRYGHTLHSTWLTNSASHLYGMRPYNKNIRPGDSMLIQVLTYGEGWHNYHHTFASDYRSSELGFRFNFTAKFIEFFALLGLAYDLRAAPNDVIKRRMLKTGDGSRTTLYSE